MLNIYALLGIFVVVSLLACCIGFKKFVWFLSIGYGFSVAALGIAYLVWGIITGTFDYIAIIQAILFVIYGARLSGFLLVREIKNASYRKVLESATATKDSKPMPFFVLFTIWIMCGILYVMQTSGMFYRMYNIKVDELTSTVSVVILPLIGAGISLIGIILESLADSQKTAQKKENPHMVATKGLYKMVRCPNYFGEILFWTGLFVGSVGILGTHIDQWIIVVIGWICIVYIMINGAQRLDRRQEKNYGAKEEYRQYADHTPLIFPLLPIYHIGAYKSEDNK